MYGIFTNICPKNHPNVGKYTIHGSYGHYNFSCSVMFPLSAHRIDGPGNRWPQARAPKCLVGRKKHGRGNSGHLGARGVDQEKWVTQTTKSTKNGDVIHKNCDFEYA